jgi:hypothetical protein
MKRFFAILAFLAGGISVEIARPLNCTLMQSTQPRLRRHTLRCNDGK